MISFALGALAGMLVMAVAVFSASMVIIKVLRDEDTR